MCFEMRLRGRVVMFDLIVMRVAGNDLELNVFGTCLLRCLDWGVVCIAGEGGRECVF